MNSSHADSAGRWKEILSSIKKKLDTQTFDTWFRPVAFHSMDDKKLYLKVPNEYFKKWLTDNYTALINEAVSDANLGQKWITFLVEDHGHSDTVPPKESNGDELRKTDGMLNPKYVFDAFVVGSCNQFAHAAARAVAEQPAKAYNPLYLYGGVGLGKTHLVQAIGHFIQCQNRRLRLAYISAEKFMNDLVVSIRYDKTLQFRERYRSIDVLLMDDIQFMTNKERTQEEFFHTFNALYDSQKQIVITSDCPPKEISGLEARLLSRFEWGLTADLQPPEYETRLAIVKRKAELEKAPVSDEVADFIARNVKSNIRELEGALIRLIAYASMEGAEIDTSYARIVLRNIVTEGKKVVSPDLIIKTVAKFFNLKPSLIKSKNNAKLIVEPRQIAMYICKELTSYSLPQIGKEFGNKHHTTVLHSTQKVEKSMRANKDFHNVVHRIIRSID
ncbi:MAG: chromosomal replication initiator protein DnaA [Acidobacteria bacterium]|nr:chromosomal replication initiator protein DnaA [Acidobacteriota bacterium]MBI3655913.1 chromosomal replication initiator protein DnaA [Acidobacteriota bacterium]